MIRHKNRHSWLSKIIALVVACLFLVNGAPQRISHAEIRPSLTSSLGVDTVGDGIITEADYDRIKGLIAWQVGDVCADPRYSDNPVEELRRRFQGTDVVKVELVNDGTGDFIFTLSEKFDGRHLRQRPPQAFARNTEGFGDTEDIARKLEGRPGGSRRESNDVVPAKDAVSEGPLATHMRVRLQKVPVGIDENTKVVLMNPDHGEAQSMKFTISPYHGTRRLEHFLEKSRGINTAVVDFNINDKDEFLALLEAHQPPVIGCAFFYETLERDLQNIWEIRQASPNSLIVVGGMEATSRADEYIKKLPIDALLLGEGEYPLAELLKRIEEGGGIADKDAFIEKCADMPGWLFKKTDGSIVRTAPAKVMTAQQYDEVFRYFDFGPQYYHTYWQFTIDNYSQELLEILDVNPRMVRMITANYCPHGCTFCVSTNFLKTASGKTAPLRRASAEEMADKAGRYLAQQPDAYIYIDDEDALIDRERMRRFCELIIERGIKGTFGCRGRVGDIIKEPELLALMRKAGFRLIATGVESYDEDVIEDFNKRITGEEADKAIEIIQGNGMRCAINLILFAPKITEGGLLKTVDKAVEYIGKDAHVGVTSYVIPYPGTKYYHNPEYEKETIGRELVVPGTGEVIDYPQAILPKNAKIRKVAENALRDGKEIIEEWKERFNWQYSVVPREISDLALFYCIYREFGLLGEKKSGIEAIAERIFKNERRAFFTGIEKHYTDYIDDSTAFLSDYVPNPDITKCLRVPLKTLLNNEAAQGYTRAYQKQGVAIEIYGSDEEGQGAINEQTYAELGLEYRPLPLAEKTNRNTVTLVLDERCSNIKDQASFMEATGGLNQLKTIIVPITQREPAALIRGSIFGFRLLHIMNNRLGPQHRFVQDTINHHRALIESMDPSITFELTPETLSDMAQALRGGNIAKIVPYITLLLQDTPKPEKFSPGIEHRLYEHAKTAVAA